MFYGYRTVHYVSNNALHETHLKPDIYHTPGCSVVSPQKVFSLERERGAGTGLLNTNLTHQQWKMVFRLLIGPITLR
jgi:hypothetical protein